MATLAAVLDAPIPPPVQAGPLAPVLLAILVRDPAARPDAAYVDRMLAQVENNLANPAPAQGAPPSRSYPPPADVRPAWTPPVQERAAKRRSRAIIASAMATAVLGMTGALVWTLHGLPGASAPSWTGAAAGTQSAGAPGRELTPVTTPPTAMGTQGELLTPASVQAAITAFHDGNIVMRHPRTPPPTP